MAIFSIGDRIPRVGKDVWVAETAFVSGDVNLGERVSVWPNASIRGDIEPISIEEGSNVQDGAVIHTDFGFACRIGKNVTRPYYTVARSETAPLLVWERRS